MAPVERRVRQAVAEAPDRDGRVEHVLVPEHERAVLRDLARVGEPPALEVVVEYGRRADAPRERHQQLACACARSL